MPTKFAIIAVEGKGAQFIEWHPPDYIKRVFRKMFREI